MPLLVLLVAISADIDNTGHGRSVVRCNLNEVKTGSLGTLKCFSKGQIPYKSTVLIDKTYHGGTNVTIDAKSLGIDTRLLL